MKFTAEVTQQILNLIKAGNYRTVSCAAAGVDTRTLSRWLAKGAAGEEPYASFVVAMDEAEGQGEARHVLTVTSASKEDWRAAAWILSRKYNKRWGDKVQVEIQETLESFLTLMEEVVKNACGPEVSARVLAEVASRFGGEATSENQRPTGPTN